MNETSPSAFAVPLGVAAFRRGRSLEDNPYLPNSPSWHEWNNGYEAASIERKTQ